MVHAASDRSFCPKYHSRARAPSSSRTGKCRGTCTKTKYFDIDVLSYDLYWKCSVTFWQPGSLHLSLDVLPRMADSGSGTGRGTAAASASYSSGWVAEGSVGRSRC